MRHCVRCMKPIPLSRLASSHWKAHTCSDECKRADYAEIRNEKALYRIQKGLCPVCGSRRKSRSTGKCASANETVGTVQGNIY